MQNGVQPILHADLELDAPFGKAIVAVADDLPDQISQKRVNPRDQGFLPSDGVRQCQLNLNSA